MKLKTDNGVAVLKDGHPVYIHDDGTEAAFDAANAVATIKARNAEAKTNRERAEELASKLKLFEGIEDPSAAVKALEVIKNLDHKKLVDAGQVEQIKAEINKAWEGKLTESQKALQETQQQLHGAVVGGAFARSKFLTEKTVLPPDVAQAYFEKNVKLEGGQIRVIGPDGNPVYSRTKPGEPAEFDEALEILVSSHPRRDSLLRGDNKGGSGANPNTGGSGGAKTIARAQFDKLDPLAQHAHVKGGGTVSD